MTGYYPKCNQWANEICSKKTPKDTLVIPYDSESTTSSSKEINSKNKTAHSISLNHGKMIVGGKYQKLLNGKE